LLLLQQFNSFKISFWTSVSTFYFFPMTSLWMHYELIFFLWNPTLYRDPTSSNITMLTFFNPYDNNIKSCRHIAKKWNFCIPIFCGCNNPFKTSFWASISAFYLFPMISLYMHYELFFSIETPLCFMDKTVTQNWSIWTATIPYTYAMIF
jgi:hypothetical protein